MTFGQQPRGNGQYEPQGADGLNTNYQQQNYQQQGYAYQQAQAPYGAAGGAATATFDTTAQYSYDSVRKAEHASVTKAYGEMTIGLVVTAVVAYLTQATGLLVRFLLATGGIGVIGLCIAQIALALVLGARIMKMRPGTARLMFYVYAALMGFTLSSIFFAYTTADIVTVLAICAVFFLALTMLSLTTKIDMTKFGPILFVGLIVLIITQVVLMFFVPSDGTLRMIAGLGVVLFAGMTMYDAQQTRAIFSAYGSQGPEMIQRVSILCALNLYLDFVNMFLYLLRLLGNRD